MKKYFVLLPLMCLLVLGGAFSVAAQTASCNDPQGSPTICLTNPLGDDTATISDLLQRIINYLYLIAGPILGIIVIIGGFQMLTARDNETQFVKGKKTVTYAAIGFAVILIADGVNLIIKNFFQS